MAADEEPATGSSPPSRESGEVRKKDPFPPAKGESSGFLPTAKLPPIDPRAKAFPVPKRPIAPPKPVAAKPPEADDVDEPTPPLITEDLTDELHQIEDLVIPEGDDDEEGSDAGQAQAASDSEEPGPPPLAAAPTKIIARSAAESADEGSEADEDDAPAEATDAPAPVPETAESEEAEAPEEADAPEEDEAPEEDAAEELDLAPEESSEDLDAGALAAAMEGSAPESIQPESLEAHEEPGGPPRDDSDAGRRETGSIPPPLTLERGPIARFGRFDILGRLAVGGMADLLLCRESAEGGASRHAVLKLIRGEFSEDSAFAKMFIDEGRLAMRLTHPTICTVYEVGREHGRFFMAMEYVEGQTLQMVIARGVSRAEPMPVPFLLRLFSQVAEALDFAHNVRDEKGRRLNIVHRDVSPNNIMVRYDGVVKLLDFGVAKAERNQSATVSGAVKGKFSYMSPEQAMSEPVDFRSDIFSLGVCMFEAATGRRLYRRKAQYEVLKAILKEPAPSLRSVREELPQALEDIILKCLEKEPDDRYQSAADLQHDLESLIAELSLVVNTRAMSKRMQVLFAKEMAAGPELDTGHAVRERFEHLVSERPPPAALAPPTANPTIWLGWVAAAVLLAGFLGLAGWIATSDDNPTPDVGVQELQTPPPTPDPVVEPTPPDPPPVVATPDPPPVEVTPDPPATEVDTPLEGSGTGEDQVDSTPEDQGGDPALAQGDGTPETGQGDDSSTGNTGRRRRRRRRGGQGRRGGGGGDNNPVVVTDPGFGP